MELLKDIRWQKRRSEILGVRGWKCEQCGATTGTINVHHRRYKKGAKPWEYDDDDLKVLCEKCHHDLHSLGLNASEVMDLVVLRGRHLHWQAVLEQVRTGAPDGGYVTHDLDRADEAVTKLHKLEGLIVAQERRLGLPDSFVSNGWW